MEKIYLNLRNRLSLMRSSLMGTVSEFVREEQVLKTRVSK